MGLDMYLKGRAFLFNDDTMRDGFKVRCVELDLGYWRKHPDLHGYIVQTFAKGEDDQQSIPLTAENMVDIIRAIEADELPHTEGFFFGDSSRWNREGKSETIKTFRDAINWLEGKPVLPTTKNPQPLGDSGMVMVQVNIEAMEQMGEAREVFYAASW